MQLLSLVSHEANTVVPTHGDHLLEIPIRTGIIGPSAEIMVLSVGICVVARIQHNVRTHGSVYTVAEGANLCAK